MELRPRTVSITASVPSCRCPPGATFEGMGCPWLLMIMMGKANWWMPRWLDRLVPEFSIEGAEFFRERDKKAASTPEPVPVGAGPEHS